MRNMKRTILVDATAVGVSVLAVIRCHRWHSCRAVTGGTVVVLSQVAQLSCCHRWHSCRAVTGGSEGEPKGWSTVLITALGSWGKHREGDP
jgi:hypothetical protein